MLVETSGMLQHVHVPTHRKGHALDMVITKETDSILQSDIKVSDPHLFSKNGKPAGDHFVVSVDISVSKPQPEKGKITVRKLPDMDPFREDIRKSDLMDTTGDLATLLERYDSALCSVIDVHAPECQEMIIIRPNTPWYTPELRKAKRERRKLERKWMKTKMAEDHNAYRQQCWVVNTLLQEAKTTDYFQR